MVKHLLIVKGNNMTTEVSKMIQDIDSELHRAKEFVNTNEYSNMTAINVIVRKYRNELKQLRKVMAEDRDEGLIDYKDLL